MNKINVDKTINISGSTISPLQPSLLPGVYVEETDEYKSFTFTSLTKPLNSNIVHWMLSNDIKKLCPKSYWKCIHIYVRGKDYLNGEEYCINNNSLDIPFVKKGINDVLEFWKILFKEHCMSGEGSSVDITDFNIIFKRFKVKKHYTDRYIPNKVYVDVFERDNYTCQICGATKEDGVKLHVDHIIPIAKGGTNDIDNLQVLCQRCNSGKSDRMDLKCTKEKIIKDKERVLRDKLEGWGLCLR